MIFALKKAQSLIDKATGEGFIHSAAANDYCEVSQSVATLRSTSSKICLGDQGT